MINKTSLLILFLFTLLLQKKDLWAQPVYALSLPQKVDKADAICVGDLMPLSAAKAATSPETTRTLVIGVEEVLKGMIPTKNITVTVGPDVYVPATITHGMFFLLGDGKSRYWDLAQYQPPVIDLGPAPTQALPPDLTPLRAVTLALARALNTSGTDVRLQLLDLLTDAGLILNPKIPQYIRIAAHLGETAGFGPFCIANILPLTKALDTDPDMLVRVSALKIQAIFQDQSALPALRRIVEASGEAPDVPGYVNRAAEALACYNTTATATYMLRALQSPLHRVRSAALSSLVYTLGRTAIPLLIDRIETKDIGDQAAIIWWLYEVTGEMDPRVHGPVTAQRQEYISYWLRWEKVHHDEVGRFRTQLATLARN